MEATYSTFTRSNPELVALTRKHIDDRKLSVKELAARSNINRSMLHQYLNDKYQKPESVEPKLKAYLADQGSVDVSDISEADIFTHNQPGSRFYQSTDAKGIAAMCSLAHRHTLLNVVVGKSGYGKTHTLKQYSGLPKVAYIECDDTMERRDLVEALEQTLGVNQGYGSICKRTNNIVRHLHANPGWLIIIDEADKLINRSTQKKMEIIRKVFDKAPVGIVLAGEPQLEPILNAYDERMSKRGSYIFRLAGLGKSEVAEYLAVFPVDKAARDVFVERACNSRSGCFRLLDRTLTNVIRLLQEQGGESITLELVEQASNMMML